MTPTTITLEQYRKAAAVLTDAQLETVIEGKGIEASEPLFRQAAREERNSRRAS